MTSSESVRQRYFQWQALQLFFSPAKKIAINSEIHPAWRIAFTFLYHRIVRVGRDLCESPSPTPLPKQGHLEQATQDLVQVGFEYLQRRRLHNHSGQLVPVLHHPQSKVVLPCNEVLALYFSI